MNKKVFSISINGKIGLNLHDLNNEKTEGNQLTTRYVTIVDGNGNLATVNAVSGDMLKHIQAGHLYNIAREANNLPLCQGCQKFDANRITIDEEFDKFTANNDKSEIVDKLLEMCVMDDLEGVLITNNNQNIGRDSVVEFGWLVAIPDEFYSENLFHVKYSNNTYFNLCLDALKGEGIEISDDFRQRLSEVFAEKPTGEDLKNIVNELSEEFKLSASRKKMIESYLQEQNSNTKNLGQNIFYRPVNSGQYAVVNNLEIARIGYNDIAKTYSIDKDSIKNRYKALLKSIMLTYYSPEGAMRNTQSPHLTSFMGVVSISYTSVPAPTVSALNPQYREEIMSITETLKKLGEDVELREFNSMAEFCGIINDLIQDTVPYGA